MAGTKDTEKKPEGAEKKQAKEGLPADDEEYVEGQDDDAAADDDEVEEVKEDKGTDAKRVAEKKKEGDAQDEGDEAGDEDEGKEEEEEEEEEGEEEAVSDEDEEDEAEDNEEGGDDDQGTKRKPSSKSQPGSSKKQKTASSAKKVDTSKPNAAAESGTVGSKHDDPRDPATRGSADRLPKKGQTVHWKALPGYVEGEVVEILTADKEVDGKSVKATKKDPRIVLKSSKSGKICVHKAEAVYFDAE